MLYPACDVLPQSLVLRNDATVHIRHINGEDFFKGFLELLRFLSSPRLEREVTHAEFVEYMKVVCHSKIVLVAECARSSRIIATISVCIERKFLHNFSTVGHIEDLVIHPDFRHLDLGRALVRLCLGFCFRGVKTEGGGVPLVCYKVILSCEENNAEFYRKCGFHVWETQMRIDKEHWM